MIRTIRRLRYSHEIELLIGLKINQLRKTITDLMTPYNDQPTKFNRVIVPDRVAERVIGLHQALMRLQTRDPGWHYGEDQFFAWRGKVVYPESVINRTVRYFPGTKVEDFQ